MSFSKIKYFGIFVFKKTQFRYYLNSNTFLIYYAVRRESEVRYEDSAKKVL